MPGKVFRKNTRDLYFVGIDFDKELGLKEFCNIKKISFEELKQKFIIEQHEGDPNSLHLYFYSEIPFTDKCPDTVLGIEIKSNCKGLMCVTPSYHYETKSRWQIKGTDSPITLKSEEASKLMNSINDICKKYNVKYLQSNGNDNGNGHDGNGHSILTEELKQISRSLKIPIPIPITNTNSQYIIKEGLRHDTLLAFANSLLFNHKPNNNFSNIHLKNFLFEINECLCPEVNILRTI